MQHQINALIGILERMEPLYLRIYDILQSERDALVKLDYEKIYEVLVEKDEVTSVLRTLDAERLRLQDQLSILLDLENSDINLKQISQLIQKNHPNESSKLLTLRSKINRAISLVVDRLGVNRSLIEKSIKNLQDIAKNFSKAISGESSQEPSTSKNMTYDGRAKFISQKQSAGALVKKQL